MRQDLAAAAQYLRETPYVRALGFGALVGGVGLPATCLVTGLGFVALVTWALARLRGARPVAVAA